MVDFRVLDDFYDHPKTFDMPDSAVALWTRAGSWCMAKLTDGFVPAAMAQRYCEDPDRAIKWLVERGIWIEVEGGFQYHDWLDAQRSREQVEAEKAKWAAQKAAQRERQQRARDARLAKLSTVDTAPDYTQDSLAESAFESTGESGTESSGSLSLSLSLSQESKEHSQDQAAQSAGDDPFFAEFWTAWPRKVAKGQARRAWNTALKKTTAATIITAAQTFAARCVKAGTDPQYMPHPSTWLNGERWNDEEPPRKATVTRIAAAEMCPKHRGKLARNCGECRFGGDDE